MAFVVRVRISDEEMVGSVSGANVSVATLPPPPAGFEFHEISNATDLTLIQAQGLSKFTYNRTTNRIVAKVDNRAIVQFDTLLVQRFKGQTEPTINATRISGVQTVVRLGLSGMNTFLRLDFSSGVTVPVTIDTSKACRFQIVDSPQGRVDEQVDVIITTPANRIEF